MKSTTKTVRFLQWWQTTSTHGITLILIQRSAALATIRTESTSVLLSGTACSYSVPESNPWFFFNIVISNSCPSRLMKVANLEFNFNEPSCRSGIDKLWSDWQTHSYKFGWVCQLHLDFEFIRWRDAVFSLGPLEAAEIGWIAREERTWKFIFGRTTASQSVETKQYICNSGEVVSFKEQLGERDRH